MASGHAHAAMGLLAGVLVGAATHQGPVVSLGYGLVSSGAALLPDIDTETSTVSAAVPLSRVLLAPVRVACRGHRQASHSLLGAGVLLAGLLAGLLALGHFAASSNVSAVHQWPARALFPALMAWLGLRATLTLARVPTTGGSSDHHTRPLLSRHLRSLVGLAGAAFVAWVFTYRTGTLDAAASSVVLLGVLGYLTHLLGDAVFNGIPLLWPVRARVRLTRLVTGTAPARVLDVLLGVASLVLALVVLGAGR